jgi:hypothetical protein
MMAGVRGDREKTMTPQERKLLDDLFDRLASLESAPRDPDAARAIEQGMRRAPNALYPLVQTVLVQDEALKRADARIRELEDELDIEPGQPVQQPGFLDSMRGALLGGRETHGSVPTVRPGAAPAATSPWGNKTGYAGVQPDAYAQQQMPPAGGSFLGTAAATVAGVVGGALLMNSFRGMFGGHGAGQGAFDSGSAGTPWGSDASGSGLARDAGIDDIGSGGGGSGAQPAGLFDSAQNDSGNSDFSDDADDGGFDLGGDGGDDSA